MPTAYFAALCPLCSKRVENSYVAHGKSSLPVSTPPVRMQCPHCRGVAFFSFQRGRVSNDPPVERLIKDELRGVPWERRRYCPIDEPLKKDIKAVEKALKDDADDG